MSASLTLERDLEAFVRRDEAGRGRLELLVTGARCAACIRKIETAVAGLPGVTGARLNLTTGKLAVELAGNEAHPERVVETVEGLGYRACLFDPAEAVSAIDREGRELAVALGVAGFGAGNVMMFTVPAWAGLFGQELTPATLDPDVLDGRDRRDAVRVVCWPAVLPVGLGVAAAGQGQYGRADLDRRDPDPDRQLLGDHPWRASTPISTLR
jgi:cation transport ATPase